jgi:hypothetical protein
MNIPFSDGQLFRGGLAVFINKRNILPGISLVDTILSELMWFKLNAIFGGFVRDLYVCFIYIASVNSSYVKSTGLDKQVFAFVGFEYF